MTSSRLRLPAGVILPVEEIGGSWRDQVNETLGASRSCGLLDLEQVAPPGS